MVETHNRNKDIIWELILKTDPTKNKQYLQWIITKGILKWSNKSFYLFKQDLPTLTSLLVSYDKLKRMNKLRPEHKDINRIKNDDELFYVVSQYQEAAGRTKEQDEQLFKNKEAKKLYESSSIEVVIPYTKKASCYFGVNTKWCTARNDENNAFATYNREAPLYIVLDKKTGKKYQFWFDTSEDEAHQFMDYKDNEIVWSDLIKKQPDFVKELRKVFDKLATSCSFIYLMNKVKLYSLLNFLLITDDYPEKVFEIIKDTLDLSKLEIASLYKRFHNNFYFPVPKGKEKSAISKIIKIILKLDDISKIKHKDKQLLLDNWSTAYNELFGDSK